MNYKKWEMLWFVNSCVFVVTLLGSKHPIGLIRGLTNQCDLSESILAPMLGDSIIDVPTSMA